MTPNELNAFMLADTSEICRSTTAISGFMPPDRPSHIGSGVLLRIADTRFLVTAAHVADECVKPYKAAVIGTPTGDDVVQIFRRCGLTTNMPPSGHRDDDPIDIAILELRLETFEKLETYMRFITLNDVEWLDEKLKDGLYLVNGFPSFRCKIDEMDEEVVSQNLPFFTTVYDSTTNPAFDLKPRDHIALEAHPPYELEAISYGIDVNTIDGISGCGIWRILDHGEPFESFDWRKAKLVGIVTEQSTHDPSEAIPYIRGTKIVWVVSVIYDKWPELQAEIRKILPVREAERPG